MLKPSPEAGYPGAAPADDLIGEKQPPADLHRYDMMRPAVTGAVANSDDLIFGPPFIARTFALIGHRAPPARPIANGFPVRHMRSPPRIASRRQRSEEHTSELQSLMRTSYAVFGLKTKKSK